MVSILAGILLVLWWLHRGSLSIAQGGDTSLPAISPGPGTPLFNETVGGAGPVSFGGSNFNIGGPSLFNTSPGGCNCPASTSWSNFGTTADLAAWLAQQPGYLATAQDGLTNWN